MNPAYVDFLKREIFKTTEYDQFNLLFDALNDVLKAPASGVAILERSYIYGGRSLFAPLVPKSQSPAVIDYRPHSAESRSNYQGSWIDQSDFQFPIAEHSVLDLGTGYRFSFDRLESATLLIPNVLHHCRDFSSLMASLQSAMPRLKRVFIFDSYLREGHQTPDDFCRYTPSALEHTMRALGFGEVTTSQTGNVFDGILYLISQARWQLENAPELADIRLALDALQPRLREVRRDERYRPLGRPYASLVTAFAMTFSR